jgi:hypothetical protein
MGLKDAVASSDAIVVARAVSISSSMVAADDVPGYNLPPGRKRTRLDFAFTVVRCLKGVSGPSIALADPWVSTFQESGNHIPTVVPGDICLLLLKRSGDGQWYQCSSDIPYAPLDSGPDQPESASGDLQAQVSALLSPTLSNSRLRRYSIYLLSTMDDVTLLPAMTRYSRGPDLLVDDSALVYLARHQVPSAIPDIGRVTLTPQFRDCGTDSAVDLMWYKRPDSLLGLCRLLLGDSFYLRTNAASALRAMPVLSLSSVPYLMLALLDPDKDIAGSACQTLHAAVPELGPCDDGGYFDDHLEFERAEHFDWWRHLLNGERVAGHSQYAGAFGRGAQGSASAVMGLFSPEVSVRVHTAALYAAKRDRGDIPYFVLALEDPDPRMQYTCYCALSALVPGSLPAVPKKEYMLKRAEMNDAAFTWWRQYLLGLHRLD